MREVIFDHSSLLDLSRELLVYGRYFRFKTKGFSMYPFIRDGDVITIRPIDPICLNVGDIIFYQVENRLVVHRIIGKKTFDGKIRFTTRGDWSPGSEEEIFDNAVLGKVVTLERNRKILQVDQGLSHCLIKCWPVFYRIVRLAVKFVSIIRRRIVR